MTHLLLTVAAAVVAFVTTNIDDILLLMLFFAQANTRLRKRHVVAGHYAGFSAIIAISLLGLAGALILPRSLIGWLGLIPMALGLYQLLHKHADEDDETLPEPAQRPPPSGLFANLISPQTLSVAGVTLANGADNISVYVPLFASQHPQDVALMVVIFLLLVGVWLYAGYRLVRHPAIARLLEHYGEQLVPYVFILLGVYLLLENLILP